MSKCRPVNLLAKTMPGKVTTEKKNMKKRFLKLSNLIKQSQHLVLLSKQYQYLSYHYGAVPR